MLLLACKCPLSFFPPMIILMPMRPLTNDTPFYIYIYQDTDSAPDVFSLPGPGGSRCASAGWHPGCPRHRPSAHELRQFHPPRNP